MSAIVVSNTTEQQETTPDVPVKPDGTPYRFEMLFNGLVDRAYADDAEDLLGCMIPRYESMTVGERTAARLSHAVRTQTTVQADINWHYDNLAGCTPEEKTVLMSSRSTPPEISEWSSTVPIVLVDVFYRPIGALPNPVSTIADVNDPPNIFWLRVEDEYDYLVSLASIGFVELHVHNDFES